MEALAKIIILEVFLLFLLLFLAHYSGQELNLDVIKDVLLDILPSFLIFIILILIVKIIMDILKTPIKTAVHKFSGSDTKADMLWRSMSHVIWIIVVLFLFFSIWAQTIDPTALIGLGVIIAAIVYVSGKPIMNFVGWITIITSGPYRIGDRIEMDGKRGYVVDVTLMATTVREFGSWMGGDTFTGRLVSIPNSKIFDTEVHNFTKHSDYIYDEVSVLVTYESDYTRTEEIIMGAAKHILDYLKKGYKPILTKSIELEGLMREFPLEPRIFWKSEDSGVRFSLIYLTPASTRREVRSALMRNILLTIQEDKKVNIAYPHMAIVRADDPKEKHERGF
jgi:small-conductance mechanosensitive channel